MTEDAAHTLMPQVFEWNLVKEDGIFQLKRTWKAIILCPNVSLYWTNRALCHLKRHNWERVEEDFRRAIQLDNHSVKISVMAIDSGNLVVSSLESNH
ncbi:hypothetical protein AHAS_Ahas15G0079600 [Arachis hypogaea]